jgi:hypothetical protein
VTGADRVPILPGLQFGLGGGSRRAAAGRALRLAADAAIGRLEGIALRRFPARPQSVSLAVVFLAWDPERSAEVVRALGLRLDDWTGPVSWLIVDNSGTGASQLASAPGSVVSGDNRSQEFSGWEVGVRRARLQPFRPDVWLLANDRCLAYGYPFLEALHTGTGRAVRDLGAISGHIDAYPGPAESFGEDVSWWVTTNFVLLSDRALDSVLPLVQIDEDGLNEVLLRTLIHPDHPFVPHGPIGPAHRQYLTEWLTGADANLLPDHWYRSETLDDESWPRFRAKVQSILNEQLLSARGRRAGVPLLPIRLAARLGQLDPRCAYYESLAAAATAAPGAGRALDRRASRLAWAGRGLTADCRIGR